MNCKKRAGWWRKQALKTCCSITIYINYRQHDCRVTLCDRICAHSSNVNRVVPATQWTILWRVSEIRSSKTYCLFWFAQISHKREGILSMKGHSFSHVKPLTLKPGRSRFECRGKHFVQLRWYIIPLCTSGSQHRWYDHAVAMISWRSGKIMPVVVDIHYVMTCERPSWKNN
jgi:hypothetical protein